MYYLFKTKRISTPSEYWNMKLGDKIVLRAFIEREILDKNKKWHEIENKKIPVMEVEVL
ncbi:hypothetical protein ACJDT4_00380 [Clostridium neuense]|uniref:Uncharacterized protein n=1 Tax=Clostridium neuense TaxID=1728934 RepID=A0ABW8T9P6_9CLOT